MCFFAGCVLMALGASYNFFYLSLGGNKIKPLLMGACLFASGACFVLTEIVA